MIKPLLISLSLMLACGSAYAAAYDDAFCRYQKGDYATALKLMKPLAEQGNVNAQYNIGVMYNESLVKPDYAEAAKCFRRRPRRAMSSPRSISGRFMNSAAV